VSIALWWIRRDLRLSDNPALAAACAVADRVIPVFVIDPTLWRSPWVGAQRLAFLSASLRALAADLRARGGELIVRRGDPLTVLATLRAECGAEGVYAERDYSPYARRRDERVGRALLLHLIDGLAVHAPGAVLKADGAPYTVYTPFARAWRALPIPSPTACRLTSDRLTRPGSVPSDPLPEQPALDPSCPWTPGEAAAQRRLSAFTEGTNAPIYNYAQARQRLDLDGTSGLSPYLRFGVLSARQAVNAALAAIESAPTASARQGAEAWLSELIWREFYIHILHHFPHVRRRSFRSDLDGIAWANDEADFAAWCEGRTGYPVVDAAMRQLAASGWMHNRARMIVASFLCKDLLIDWRWGERWFMQHLIDGDPAANNGGWQWTAGTGTDAAPYFRVFNPVRQGISYDPEGTYVRRWVPELARVPTDAIHAPWQMSPAQQEAAGCVIGRDYPAPIVDHAMARKRALAVYRQAQSHARD